MSYFNACDPDILSSQFYSSVLCFNSSITDLPIDLTPVFGASKENPKEKYKPVHLKTKSVLSDLPEKFQIVRTIIGDPLADIPSLDPNPPQFQPTGRYTTERKEVINKEHLIDLLWESERDHM